MVDQRQQCLVWERYFCLEALQEVFGFFSVSKGSMRFFLVLVHSLLQGGMSDHLVKGRVFLVIQWMCTTVHMSTCACALCWQAQDASESTAIVIKKKPDQRFSFFLTAFRQFHCKAQPTPVIRQTTVQGSLGLTLSVYQQHTKHHCRHL